MTKTKLKIDVDVDTDRKAPRLVITKITEKQSWYQRLFRKPKELNRLGYGVTVPLRLTKKTCVDIQQEQLLWILTHTKRMDVRAENEEEVRV